MTFSLNAMLFVIFALILFKVMEPFAMKQLNKIMFGGFHERWVVHDINRMIRELRYREEKPRIMKEMQEQQEQQMREIIEAIKSLGKKKDKP